MQKHHGAHSGIPRILLCLMLILISPLNAMAIEPIDRIVEDVNNGAFVQTLQVSPSARYYNSKKHGLKFGGAVHALGADAASFVARGDHIFVPYYHEDFTVRLVRMNLRTGTKMEITFEQSKVPCGGQPELQDSHHNFGFEISDDGMMHLFFGHHRSRLRYLKSVAGGADVSDSAFNVNLFPAPPKSLTDNMVRSRQGRACQGVETREWPFLNPEDGVVSPITYPRLARTRHGMVLFFRQGISPRMSSLFAVRYEGNGQWSRRFKVIDGYVGTRELGDGQISSSRRPYMHGYGGLNSTHIAWTYREDNDRPYGIYYGTSSDHKVWKSQNGKLLAQDNKGYHNDISLNVEGRFTTVDPDLTGAFMFVRVIEDNFQNPHITAYRFFGRIYGVNVYELVHYTPVQGEWQKNIIGKFTGQQPTLIPDPHSGDMFLVMNDYQKGVLRVQKARRSDSWQNWETIYEGSPGYVSHGYARFVQDRLVVALQQEIATSDDDSSPFDLLAIEIPGMAFAMD